MMENSVLHFPKTKIFVHVDPTNKQGSQLVPIYRLAIHTVKINIFIHTNIDKKSTPNSH